MKSKLTFAAVIRVSTEKQDQQGESLRNQKTQNIRSAEILGGTIIEWYGGQEHATPGYEKKEIDRLLNNAQKKTKKFNAVLFNNADRWSRDNEYSHRGIDVFKKNNIRFFIGTTEYDLCNPEHLFFIEMNTTVGQFYARNQKRKSLNNRIHRAERGLPACGKLPFGRTFVRDKKEDNGKWGLDEDKKTDIEDIATRYLAGEKLSMLAEEYGMNHANLHKILTKRCGPIWEQSFNSDELNIHEVVKTTIPRLLPEATIKAIKEKSQANKTFTHGHLKYPYLLRRVTFCKHCGYTMFGQTNHNGHQYYRHAHMKRVRKCSQPKTWVRADELEDIVMRHLFECFGNPAAVQKAIEDATPNKEEVEELIRRSKRISDKREKLSRGRNRILRLITKGVITDKEAEKELGSIKQKDSTLQSEWNRIQDNLENLPNTDRIRAVSQKVSSQFVSKYKYTDSRLIAKKRLINHGYNQMTDEEKRALVELVFSGKTPEGKRMGVSIEWDANKKWEFNIHGHLIEEIGLLPLSERKRKLFFNFENNGGGYKQKELVTKSALCCRAQCLP
jgi:DNA invertase Pin-like site-specific DNA recombinase